ncbi:hypothetical protein JCM8202v2_003065 [Rhodotorula sphaerocarpa]
MNGGGTAEAVLTKPPAESISPSPTGTSIAMSSEATNASTAPATATTSASLASSTEPSSNSSSGVPAEYQMPQPFDSTLGTNFSSTACPSFFATFLADPAFQACAPFSLLLTTSTAFFRAEKSPTTLLPHILNATCSAPLDSCAGVMDALAVKIKKPNTCGKDLELGNPLVAEALDGFNSYRLMRQAGCVTSNTTGQYCFATAAAESDPSNLYFYYLPEGTTLPSGTSPDCNSCTQDLMAIYAWVAERSHATNSTLPISRTYQSGRAAVALTCGPDFAPAVKAVSSTSSAAGRTTMLAPVWATLATFLTLSGMAALS